MDEKIVLNSEQPLKKVLIIDEQFPYNGGSRTEKFVKYLPFSGWKPIILTRSEKHGNFFNKIGIKCNRSENFKMYSTKALPSFFILNKFHFNKIAGILNSFLFIPDSNITWLPFAIKKGMQIISKEKPLIIYSSSPREGVHLIAYLLKKKSGLPWVADFRDLWTLYEGRYKPLTFIHNAINTYIEKAIYREWSDIVIANTSENKGIISKNFKVDSNKIQVITNGYDPDDTKIREKKIEDKHHFKIGFIGSIEKPALCYDEFLKAYTTVIKRKKNFKLMIWAQKSERLINLINKYNGVIDNVEFRPYVPHQQCLSELQKVDVLLILLAKKYPHVVPQKLYNYLGLKMPIIGVVPENSCAAKIILNSRCGYVVKPDNISAISDTLLQLHQAWSNDKLKIKPRLEILSQYSRATLTEKLVAIFDKICF